MKKKLVEFLNYLIKGIYAGIMIGIAGCVYLSVDNHVIGSFLFALGLLTICMYGMNLYTGKIGYVLINKPKYLLELLFTLIGNLIGTVSCGYLLFLSRIGNKLRESAEVICNVKLNDNLLSIFILSIFCGIIMYLAVDMYKKVEGFGRYVGIFMGITVFILAGFEHCVANMFYFSAANMWTWKTVLYVFIMVLGNSTGSILLALGNKYGLKK
jgi:formate/nitrite transporter FocA (FNT family)